MVLYLYLEDSHETSMMKKFCKYEITEINTLVREEKKINKSNNQFRNNRSKVAIKIFA
jgi:hypothetical protein